MCRFIEVSKETEAIGYKVLYVDPRSQRLLSIAVGTEYERNGPIAIPKGRSTSKRPINFFNSDLLESSATYNPEYAGKTAVFKELRHAQELRLSMSGLCKNNIKNVEVFKVKLTGELWEGTYNQEPVMIGSHMKILDKEEH